MTTYLDGLIYDDALDTLAHASSSVTPGVYANPSKLQIDALGHVVDIETGEVGSDYIEGLRLEYAGTHTATLQPGATFIPSLNRIVTLDTPLTLTAPSGLNGVYYAYLREASGAAFGEVSDVAPNDPYFSSARTMTGDTGARYLGMLKNDVAGNLMPFEDQVLGSTVFRTWGVAHNDNELLVVVNYNSILTSQVIGPAAATAQKRLVGPGSRSAYMRWLTKITSGTGQAYFGVPRPQPSGGSSNPATVVFADVLAGFTSAYAFARVSATQELSYISIIAGMTLSLWVAGYYEDR